MTTKVKASEIINEYFIWKNKVHEHFEYVSDWVEIPLEDRRKYYWHLEGYEDKEAIRVCFADTKKELENQEGQYYEDYIYTQRFLKKWVYRAEHYTLICVDTQTDGNKFLAIYDNSKECPCKY